MSAMGTAAAIPERRPVPGRAVVPFGEVDVVRLTTDAHEKDGFKKGEQGAVVLVSTAPDDGRVLGYLVEFDGRKHEDSVIGVGEHEIALVERRRIGEPRG